MESKSRGEERRGDCTLDGDQPDSGVLLLLLRSAYSASGDSVEGNLIQLQKEHSCTTAAV